MNENWNRNVGTNHYPSRTLHARAVACLWDALHGFYGEESLLAGTKSMEWVRETSELTFVLVGRCQATCWKA